MSSDDFDRRMHADQFHQGRGQRRCGLRPGPGQAVADVRNRRRPPLRPVRTGHHQPQQWAGIWSDRHLWSPRLGLVFKPLEKLSLYASYSRSYLPQSGDQFGGLDLTTEALKPERFDNYEFGAKWEPIEGLLATAAVYRLDRSDTRAPDPNNPAVTILTGEQRSRGSSWASNAASGTIGRSPRAMPGRRPRSASGPLPAIRPPIARFRSSRVTARCGPATMSRSSSASAWARLPGRNPMRRSATW